MAVHADTASSAMRIALLLIANSGQSVSTHTCMHACMYVHMYVCAYVWYCMCVCVYAV